MYQSDYEADDDSDSAIKEKKRAASPWGSLKNYDGDSPQPYSKNTRYQTPASDEEFGGGGATKVVAVEKKPDFPAWDPNRNYTPPKTTSEEEEDDEEEESSDGDDSQKTKEISDNDAPLATDLTTVASPEDNAVCLVDSESEDEVGHKAKARKIVKPEPPSAVHDESDAAASVSSSDHAEDPVMSD